jgi:hypothetical protein
VMKQYASQGSCFTLFKLSSRLRNERIQLPSLEIRLDLLIPYTRIELKEPDSKLRQILGREICYRFLKLFNLAHRLFSVLLLMMHLYSHSGSLANFRSPCNRLPYNRRAAGAMVWHSSWACVETSWGWRGRELVLSWQVGTTQVAGRCFPSTRKEMRCESEKHMYV